MPEKSDVQKAAEMLDAKLRGRAVEKAAEQGFGTIHTDCDQPPDCPAMTMTLTCEGGHTQKIEIGEGSMTEPFAKEWGKIIDGTSAMFIHPPIPESVLHKCGICQKPIKSEVKRK